MTLVVFYASSAALKCPALPDQQPKTQKYSVYNDIKQTKQQVLTLEQI